MIFLEGSTPTRDEIATQVIQKCTTKIFANTEMAPEQEDICAAVVLHYSLKKDRFRPCRGSFAGFVWTLAQNASRSEIRRWTGDRRDGRRTVSIDAADERLRSYIDWAAASSPAALDVQLDVRRALDRLNDDDARFASLLMERSSVTDAAAVYGCSRTSAYRRRLRIQAFFRNQGLDGRSRR